MSIGVAYVTIRARREHGPQRVAGGRCYVE
jgi:hypothetical protein